jgi:hypothetical protein
VVIGGVGSGPEGERSEDWAFGMLTEEIEATFAELDFMAPQEVARFTGEFEAERRIAPVTAALAVANACLHAGADDDDRTELARFLPRVLRSAMTGGDWPDAREALRLVRSLNRREWSDEMFAQEILQPVSIARCVEQLDQQGPAAVSEFIVFAHEIGDPAVDWLTLVLSEAQARMTRQLVAEAIAVRVQDDPTRLAPWVNDQRWYVVRNVGAHPGLGGRRERGADAGERRALPRPARGLGSRHGAQGSGAAARPPGADQGARARRQQAVLPGAGAALRRA